MPEQEITEEIPDDEVTLQSDEKLPNYPQKFLDSGFVPPDEIEFDEGSPVMIQDWSRGGFSKPYPLRGILPIDEKDHEGLMNVLEHLGTFDSMEKEEGEELNHEC